MKNKIEFTDVPISKPSDDKIGFDKMAERLLEIFLEQHINHGLVIGVEGTWGSGKSSLINLSIHKLNDIKSTLEIEPVSKRKLACFFRRIFSKTSNETSSIVLPQVVRFSPWLIGSRDKLIQQFFIQLNSATNKQLSWRLRLKTSLVFNKFCKLESGIPTLSKLSYFFITIAYWLLTMPNVTPILSEITMFLGNSLKVTSSKDPKYSRSSLEKLNLQMRKNFKELKGSIIVWIDDFDRLEPSELIEIIRLIRAVADLPNICYILAYDPITVGRCIEKLFDIEDGRAYLEKIIQIPISVPNPQRFDLHKWFDDEIDCLICDRDIKQKERDRISSVLKDWGFSYIQTPRDLVRTVSSLRFHVLPVVKHVDLGDALFIQILRLKNEPLLRWIQRYVDYLVLFLENYDISDAEIDRMGHELLIVSGERTYESQLKFLKKIKRILPGLDYSETKGGLEFRVLSGLRREDSELFKTGCRLTNPTYSSMYFTNSFTTGYISNTSLKLFLGLAVSDKSKAEEVFADWIKEERKQGGRMAEVVLARLCALKAQITDNQVERLFAVLGNQMDDLAHTMNVRFPYFLKPGRQQIFGLIESLGSSQRKRTLLHLFNYASSLSWLAIIIRDSTNRNDKSQIGWATVKKDAVLTEVEFDELSHIFTSRLASEKRKTLLKTPCFLDLMYCWKKVGDEVSCLNWIANQSSTEQGFLELLERMNTRITFDTGEVRYEISEQTLLDFFGSVKGTLDKLNLIVSNTSNGPIKERLKTVIYKIQN